MLCAANQIGQAALESAVILVERHLNWTDKFRELILDRSEKRSLCILKRGKHKKPKMTTEDDVLAAEIVDENCTYTQSKYLQLLKQKTSEIVRINYMPSFKSNAIHKKSC